MTETWRYILINGKFNQLEVKNPTYANGILTTIEDLRPFNAKDKDGNTKTPTSEDANGIKRTIYSNFFRKSFKNVLILSGAGTSINIGEGDKRGLSMKSLWAKARESYLVKEGGKEKEDGFEKICKEINFDAKSTDLEALLSQIDGYCKFGANKKIKLNGKEIELTELRRQIFQLIKDACTINKPSNTAFPHKIFLGKLLQRKQTNPRIKIFTLNYDLLFEQAATEVNAVVIDGFSFTIPRTFSGRFYDYDIVQREGSKLQEEDNFIQRVFHLHKLHGSLDWERDKDDRMVRIKDNPSEPLIIYPREAKYEDSYEQPFFEMMARFQRGLRINNDTLLICIGYSFNDKHINAAIEEALNQNPSFRLAVIDPNFDSGEASKPLGVIKNEALQSERILMVAETFSDFADHFPEIRTYENDNYESISLKHEPAKD